MSDYVHDDEGEMHVSSSVVGCALFAVVGEMCVAVEDGGEFVGIDDVLVLLFELTLFAVPGSLTVSGSSSGTVSPTVTFAVAVNSSAGDHVFINVTVRNSAEVASCTVTPAVHTRVTGSTLDTCCSPGHYGVEYSMTYRPEYGSESMLVNVVCPSCSYAWRGMVPSTTMTTAVTSANMSALAVSRVEVSGSVGAGRVMPASVSRSASSLSAVGALHEAMAKRVGLYLNSRSACSASRLGS